MINLLVYPKTVQFINQKNRVLKSSLKYLIRCCFALNKNIEKIIADHFSDVQQILPNQMRFPKYFVRATFDFLLLVMTSSVFNDIIIVVLYQTTLFNIRCLAFDIIYKKYQHCATSK